MSESSGASRDGARIFTWDDVDGLRSLAESLSSNIGNSAAVAPLLDLANRIEGLLSPRQPA